MFDTMNKEVIDGCEVCCFEISAPKKKCYDKKLLMKKILLLMLVPFAYALDFLSIVVRAVASFMVKALRNFAKLPLQTRIKKLGSAVYTMAIAGTTTYLFYSIINYLS